VYLLLKYIICVYTFDFNTKHDIKDYYLYMNLNIVLYIYTIIFELTAIRFCLAFRLAFFKY